MNPTKLQTYLVPIAPNPEVLDQRSVVPLSTPHLSPVEFELGAPLRAWTVLNEASNSELGISLSANRGYGCIHLKHDAVAVRELLTALQDNEYDNQMGAIQPATNSLKYDLWLSLLPVALVYTYSRSGRAVADWAFAYAKKKTLSSTNTVRPKDRFMALIFEGARAIFVDVEVVAVDSNPLVLVVKRLYSTGPLFKVPVWYCVVK